VIAPGARKFLDEGKPVLIGLYHGRMVGLLRVGRRRDELTILVSRSRDGEIISRALLNLGFNLARGSPGRRAVEGAKQLIDASRAGQTLVMTVDGPRGPQQEVKPGIIRIAEMTGLPIVPFVSRARTNWWFWGWDLFMGPFWSTPMVYLYGEPIAVPPDCDEDQREEYRRRLDESLSSLRMTAEDYWQGSSTNAG
jgi:lysophospholipid acyltransferase (LPLAT)-like uncharacterized protein